MKWTLQSFFLNVEIKPKKRHEVPSSAGNIDTDSILFGYVKREYSCVIMSYVAKTGEVVCEFFSSYKHHNGVVKNSCDNPAPENTDLIMIGN
ncbi:MAG: hypothetical protein IT222_00695 [Crocinitomix sp.]|nr:hypothetical protein [Crocinitomix sp.]